MGGDSEWNRVRPPLVEMPEDDAAKLISDLDALDFEMPGLGN